MRRFPGFAARVRAVVLTALTSGALAALAAGGLAAAEKQASLVGTLTGHADAVSAVTWSPDGKFLATAGFDNTVRLWSSSSLKEIRSLEGHTRLVLTAAFAPDGRRLASGGLDNSVRIWDLPAAAPERTLAGHAAAVVAAGAEARRHAGARRGGTSGDGLGPDEGQGAQGAGWVKS